MFTSSQRRTVKSLERDVGCRFEFISPPSVQEVLEASAEQVVATLSGVHPESIEYFTPTAQKLVDEQGVDALAAALATLSGFSQPPSSRSLITHEQVNNRTSFNLCILHTLEGYFISSFLLYHIFFLNLVSRNHMINLICYM